MSQLTADGEEFARMLRYAADCISFTQQVKSYHSCLDCAGKEEPLCPYRPKDGDLARINCPLWYSKTKASTGNTDILTTFGKVEDKT